MTTIYNKLRKAGAVFLDVMQRETYDLSENATYGLNAEQHSKHSKQTLVLPDTVSLHGRPCLNMSVAELQEIPQQAFKDTNLRILKINGNFLRSLPFELSKLRNLEELYAQNNKLEFLPAQVCALTKLQVLDISYNEINMLPYSISHLKYLRVLDIAYNSIKLLPESLHFLQALEVLNIDGNKTGQLNDAIFSLHNLITLKTRSNNLAAIPKQITKLKNLRELYISDNQITKIPESVKGFLRKLDSLDIDRDVRIRELTTTSVSPLLNCLKGENKDARAIERYIEAGQKEDNPVHNRQLKDISYDDDDDENPVYHFKSYAFPGAVQPPEKETVI